MKKTLLTAALATMLSVCALAATQYTNILSNQGVGIILTEDSNVVLSFIRSNGTPADFSSVFPSGYNMFGYYTMDSKGNMLTKGNVDLTDLEDGKVTIGEFKSGDRVAFWAADPNGDYIESMHRDGEKGKKRDSAYVDNNGVETMITMGVITSNGWGPEKPMSGINDSSNYIFTIATTAPTPKPIGQPLPSVALTAIVGAAILGIASFRRRLKEKSV